ncbi:MAG: ribosome-associated translation inhibitor RaiA [Peptostreptococcaceae bacterium]|nr:ribosome-associated translation inhibitor RaiA [Peptostreptococcaceae bacterium]
MLVSILGRNLRVTEAMEGNFETKLSRLDKYFNGEQDAKVTVSNLKNQQKVEVTIPFNTGVVRAEAIDDDVYNALDLAIEKLKKQLAKQKDKLMKKPHGSIRFESIESYEPAGHHEESEKIIRRKVFEYKPMSEEDAILQLELLGHDFFVFDNFETNKVTVVYKRKDGNYGLIEPK